MLYADASYDEAIANIKDAIRLHLEDHQAHHEELTEEEICVSFHSRSFSLMPELPRVMAR